MSQPHTVKEAENYLEVKFQEISVPLKFYYFWLRDFCRCEKCYNTKTKQIEHNLVSLDENVKPRSVRIDDNFLYITWDDHHKTKYTLEWLKRHNVDIYCTESIVSPVLWSKNDVSALSYARVDAEKFLKSEEGLKELLLSIIKYGFGFVTNVGKSLKATEELVTRFTFVQKTFFGEMWEVTNDYVHMDTAYSTKGLDLHTDNTYFNEAAGIQVFHLLEHTGTGGETLLVDGFKIATDIESTSKETYDLLCNYSLEADYIEKGVHYSYTAPIIQLHPVTKKLHHIRFNVYDRAPMRTIPNDQVLNYYRALKTFSTKLNDVHTVWKKRLEPGEVIFIDNWRVFHGRAEYNGFRNLVGCYIGRSDWLSVAKAYNLID